jgi:large conductance mechanosensitive channel
MKGFIAEFKAFALRGNVLDLAVGVVIGTAFSAITNSLVTNIITPPLGLLLGRIDFKNWSLNLGGDVNIQYGLFLQSVINFVIIALALFLMIRFINRLDRVARKEQADGTQPPAEKSAEVLVLEEIRDSLKYQPRV